MKPDWDKLMDEFKDSETILVADVDCTTAGKPLCSKYGVKGFPTIKHGDPSDPNAMDKYEGARSFSALQNFAKTLKPQCTPAFLENCPAEQKKELESLMALSADALKSKAEMAKKASEEAVKAVADAGKALEAAKQQEKLVNMVAKMPKQKSEL